MLILQEFPRAKRRRQRLDSGLLDRASRAGCSGNFGCSIDRTDTLSVMGFVGSDVLALAG